MLKKALFTSLLLLPTAVYADGVEIPKTVSPNFSGNYTIRAVVSTTNDARNLKFALHKFDNKMIAKEEYPSVFRPGSLNTRSGEKRPVLISFSGPFEKSQDMAFCMFTDPPKPSTYSVSTLVANFRYCKIFKIQP